MNYLVAVYSGKKIYTASLSPGSAITVGDGGNDDISLSGSKLGSGFLILSCEPGGVRALSRVPIKFGDDKSTDRIMSAGDSAVITNRITLVVFAGRRIESPKIRLALLDTLTLGRSFNSNDICLESGNVSSNHIMLQKNGGTWTVSDMDSTNGTFVNGELIDPNSPVSAENAEIFAGGFMFSLKDGILTFTNAPDEIEYSPEISHALIHSATIKKDYPMFKISPRLRSGIEKPEVDILPPPNIGMKPAISWMSLLLPPLLMAVMMGIIALLTKNFSMLIYSVPMSMVSVIVAIVNHKINMRQWNEKNGLAIEKYTEHLTEAEEEVTRAEGAYISALSATSPGVYECIYAAENVSRNLWERTTKDSDFLNVRLGTGKINSNVALKLPTTQLSVDEDPFVKQAEDMHKKHSELTGIPVCHSFKHSPATGIAGSRDEVIETTWRIMIDLATHHSYEDVKIVCIFPENEKRKWNAVKWLPHVWNSSRTSRYVACTRDEARLILREMAETLKIRRRDISTENLKEDFVPETPFYFIILADRELAESSGEQFTIDTAALGFSVLYAYGDLRTIPNGCQSVIICGTPSFIQDATPGAKGGKKLFTPDKIREGQPERFARAISPIRLIQSGGGSRMPRSITFMEGFNKKKVEDLNVMGRWEEHSSPKSLAAPIGIRENGDTFSFDIQDRSKYKSGPQFMGPHGVTAGTAGSGKSEMLTTWLLSMALTFSPDDVNFVLIEFKGNDLSNILKPLPHVAGVVSNLDDTSEIVRCLRSLKGESLRRQRIYKKSTFLSTQHLYNYQEYRKNHKEVEPLPYLVIVVDEFAQFVTQYPEYTDMFTDIARIGRSLGMYMVLTMQSPQGVIKGQVQSNITFNICLRTATAGDSKEIIGTNDAFKINAPGRAIVKVGDNAVYEQVQTFYAKAPYRPDAGSEEKVKEAEISVVTLSGQRKRPKIKDEKKKAVRDEQSEGRAVVEYIIDEAQKNNIQWARHVWKDSLPTKLFLDDIIDDKRAFSQETGEWEEKNSGLAVTVGLVDDPENQNQYNFVLDFAKDGHQVLYGAPSTGKTTFLQTVLLSAVQTYTPEQLNFIVFDYGKRGMKILESLPHCITVADPSDEAKLGVAKDFLVSEMTRRKNLFSQQDVQTLEAYCDISGDRIPSIIVVADNMKALHDQNEALVELFAQISNDGAGYGIYLMLTAGSTGNYMYRIAQNVNSNHTLQMTDKADYRTVLGLSGSLEALPGNFKGRGLTGLDLEFQTALGVKAETEKERVNALRDLCKSMSDSWKGERATLDLTNLGNVPETEGPPAVSDENGIIIGTNRKTHRPVKFVFKDMNCCVISGATGGGKSTMLAVIARALAENPQNKLYICCRNEMFEKLCPGAVISHTSKENDEIISELAKEFDSRDENSEGRIFLLIDDFDMFYEGDSKSSGDILQERENPQPAVEDEGISQKSSDILNIISQSGPDKGMYIYIACPNDCVSRMYSYDIELFSGFLTYGNAIVLGENIEDYEAFSAMHKSYNIQLSANEGCMIHNERAEDFTAVAPDWEQQE